VTGVAAGSAGPVEGVAGTGKGPGAGVGAGALRRIAFGANLLVDLSGYRGELAHREYRPGNLLITELAKTLSSFSFSLVAPACDTPAPEAMVSSVPSAAGGSVVCWWGWWRVKAYIHTR
jgi:hypothetical protein